MKEKVLNINNLTSGATALLHADPSEPVVSLQAWVKAGSIYEDSTECGRLHLLEHMLFQAAEAQMGVPPATVIESLGGHLNAFTSPDEMVIHLSLPANHWHQGLKILTLLLFPKEFPKYDLEKEKEVVLEEIKREQDAPDRLLFRDLLEQAFNKHAYARPVLGDTKTVKTTQSKDLFNLHQRLFQPQRIAFSIVGDISETEVVDALEILVPPSPANTYISEPTQAVHQGLSVTIKEKELFEHRLAIAWPIPQITEAQAPGLEILCMLWGQGASSPLDKKLRWEKQMVNEIGVSLFQPAHAGLAVLSIFGIHESLHSVLAQIYETLFKLIKDGPSKEELEKARAWVEAAQAYRGETVQGRAQLYGESFLRYQTPHLADLFFERLLNVTREDIQLLALRFLSHQNATLVAHVPKGQGKEFEQLEQLWKNLWKPPIVATLPPQPALSKANKHQPGFTTDNTNQPPIVKKLWGQIPVVYQATNKIPAMHFYAAWPHGQTYESQSQQGVGTLHSEMMLLETQQLDHDQLANAVDLQTTHLGSFFGRNSAGIHFGCVQSRYTAAFSLFKQVLFEPHFTQANFQKTISLLQKDMERRFDYPTNIAVELFHKTIWPPNHPYGRLAAGTPDSLKTRTLDEIQKQHWSVFLNKKPSLSLVGKFNTEEMHSFLEGELSPLKDKGSNLFQLPQIKDTQQNDLTYYPFEGEQTHLVLGYEGLDMHAPEQDALLLLMACLNGQSGLLFQELREKYSLCYQVQGFHFEGLLPGACGFYLGCAHEKTTRALFELEALINNICHKAFDEKRIESAKNLLIGQQQISQQRIQNRALGFCINTTLGKPHDHHLRLANRLSKIRAKDLQKVATKVFENQNKTRILVGKLPKELAPNAIDGKKILGH